VRIISGKYKGKSINPGKKLKARPTTDFAKESLFNIINNNYYIEDLKILDLFSGTGSISYEFSSRGSEDITAVEINHKHLAFIERISKEINANIKPVHKDVFKYLKYCEEKYDMIFADPPFDMKGIETLPKIISERGMLKKNGWLIIEHSNTINFSKLPNFEFAKQYGKVNFSFLNYSEPDDTVFKHTIDENSFLSVIKIHESSEALLKKVQLNDYDRDIFDKIKNEKIKAQWLSVRLLVSELLNENKHIVYDKHDKPHLSDKSYNISISHTKDLVAVLLSKDKLAGIDIEYKSNRILKIINKFLNKQEISDLEKDNEIVKYLLYWNAKETLYKLYGKKNLIFKDNLLISSFKLNNEGSFNGEIQIDNNNKDHVLNYKVFNDFTLVWCLK